MRTLAEDSNHIQLELVKFGQKLPSHIFRKLLCTLINFLFHRWALLGRLYAHLPHTFLADFL